ncbi:homoserine dehydrogenase [Marivirga atlantica]|jgi:homoserine dehydrogenase|uniref:Homoserine dehydrogenase n=1 Tax=Marivirga atlantica TaxID=1548457 RepID=A0A937DIS1_9BACT|nr:homoserine dehydrogenase [Marivirga atlantica]MBL0765260.1 homoserine dehydrogenase [Marivirga atlantica]
MQLTKVAIFGLGTVGQGVFEKLNSTASSTIQVEAVVVKNEQKERDVNGYCHLLKSENDVFSNDDIQVIIELINDYEQAYHIVKKALSEGRTVITANKKMLSFYLEELLQIAEVNGSHLYYEAAVCGSIPIINLLNGFYTGNRPVGLKAIANGTSNYILSKLNNGETNFDMVLKKAQDAGFAEVDPSDDVKGFDARAKLQLMMLHAFGVLVDPLQIPSFAISVVNEEIILFAKKYNLSVKLIASGEVFDNKINASVIPHFINDKNSFNDVEEEQNQVVVTNQLSGEQIFRGKGAGKYPTTQSVLADLELIKKGISYNSEYLKAEISNRDDDYFYLFNKGGNNEILHDFEILFSERSHYIVKTNIRKLDKLVKVNQEIFVAQVDISDFDFLSL